MWKLLCEIYCFFAGHLYYMQDHIYDEMGYICGRLWKCTRCGTDLPTDLNTKPNRWL